MVNLTPVSLVSGTASSVQAVSVFAVASGLYSMAEVVAPSERIRSCNSRFRTQRPDDLYREESGTSMAAPHVAGLLAAFLSVRRGFRGRPDEVKELLLRTCTDIGRDRYHQGHGIPNLMRMLLEA
jgi:subtilisin family serine protease